MWCYVIFLYHVCFLTVRSGDQISQLELSKANTAAELEKLVSDVCYRAITCVLLWSLSLTHIYLHGLLVFIALLYYYLQFLHLLLYILPLSCRLELRCLDLQSGLDKAPSQDEILK